MRTLCLALLLISVVFIAGQAAHVQREKRQVENLVPNIINNVHDILDNLASLNDPKNGLTLDMLKTLLGQDLVQLLLQFPPTANLLTEMEILTIETLQHIYNIVNPVLYLISNYNTAEIMDQIGEIAEQFSFESLCLLTLLVPATADPLQLDCPPVTTPDPCNPE